MSSRERDSGSSPALLTKDHRVSISFDRTAQVFSWTAALLALVLVACPTAQPGAQAPEASSSPADSVASDASGADSVASGPAGADSVDASPPGGQSDSSEVLVPLVIPVGSAGVVPPAVIAADSLNAAATTDSTSGAVTDSTGLIEDPVRPQSARSSWSDTLAAEPPDTTGTPLPDSLGTGGLDAVGTAADSLGPAVPDTFLSGQGDTLLLPLPEARPSFEFPVERYMEREAEFLRPWHLTRTRPAPGLRPRSLALPGSGPVSAPVKRRVALKDDLSRAVVELKPAGFSGYVLYVAPREEFERVAGEMAIREAWKRHLLASLRQTQADAPGGLLDIDIPMPLPGPFVRAIGPGANLKVRGSERITFGGQTSYIV